MYAPAQFDESRTEVLQAFIRRYPFAAVVAGTSGGLDAEHVPLLLDAGSGDRGVLQGHVARANPVWRNVPSGSEVLVLFSGPEHYVSPGWYPSKQEDARMVPTWNYMTVQARGRITWNHERDWLEAFLTRLTATFEATREPPWQLTDAPREFLDRMLGGIVGLEIGITELRGKWKLSQNRSAADRLGVVSALEAELGGDAGAMASEMRALGLVPPQDA